MPPSRQASPHPRSQGRHRGGGAHAGRDGRRCHLPRHAAPGLLPRVDGRAPRRPRGVGVGRLGAAAAAEHPLRGSCVAPGRALRRVVALLRALGAGTAVLTLAAAPARRGQDCLELHAATLASLSRSASLLASPGEGLAAVRAHLAAALANKATCLDGLAGASSVPDMDNLLASLDDAYQHVTNSLSLVARRDNGGSAASFAATVAKIIHHNRRRLLEDKDDDNNSGDNDDGNTVVMTVAKDGSGNFKTVGEATAAAPNNSAARTVIRVKAGTYEENVEVPPCKTNIAVVGDGRDSTVITSSRSAADGWTTFRTATFGVSGEGFMARDITFRNTAAGCGEGASGGATCERGHVSVLPVNVLTAQARGTPTRTKCTVVAPVTSSRGLSWAGRGSPTRGPWLWTRTLGRLLTGLGGLTGLARRWAGLIRCILGTMGMMGRVLVRMAVLGGLGFMRWAMMRRPSSLWIVSSTTMTSDDIRSHRRSGRV